MKEWKGNSDSVRSRLAINKAHTTKGRETDDFYATDPEALRKLIEDGCSEWLSKHFRKTQRHHAPVWECAYGNGNLASILKFSLGGFEVIATDLKDRGYGLSGKDFLKMDADWLYHNTLYTVDTILTNPPYSLANEFILHALDILPDGGVYIALMNISYLCGQKRYETIYSKGMLREVYLFRKRIECWRNNDRETYGGKAMADFAWYVFQKGYNGQPTLYWL